MITKEKTPIRILFLRDHENSVFSARVNVVTGATEVIGIRGGRTGEAGWPARLGAAEDVDLVVDEDLDVVGLRVQLLDELRHVRGGRAVAAFQAVEDDVLSGRVVRVADPECVRARRQRRQQAKRRLYRGAVRDLGYRRVVGGDERAHLVRRGVPDVVDRELEGERDRDRRHHRGAVPRGGY